VPLLIKILRKNSKQRIHRGIVMVFSITENGHSSAVACLAEFQQKMSKFKLRQVYATKHTSRNSGASDCLDSDLHPKSQKLL
jgi:hypothetical protein